MLQDMNTPTFKIRQVAENAFEVVMHDEYPVLLSTYTTRGEAEEVADKLRALDL